MAAEGGAPAAERRDRRRVGALLNAYYHIEGSEAQQTPAGKRDTNLDVQGFDAQVYFDGMVSSGQLGDLVKKRDSLDVEIKELNVDMEKLVYQNYVQFVRATDVIKQMKFTIATLEPDLQRLQQHVRQIEEHQRSVDSGVAQRSGDIETLLKQQKNCSKLHVLFSLPGTLQSCLDKGAYGRAVEAYCTCAGFLRQYRDMPAFHKVLDEVELQMSRIRTALERRIRCPELPVDEAVNSSLTLLDLGDDAAKVAQDYLVGRKDALGSVLGRCFDASSGASSPPTMGGDAAARSEAGAAASSEQQELQRPESLRLHAACSQVTESYVPLLCDAVAGLQKLQEGRTVTAGGPIEESKLPDFVHAGVEDLFQRLSLLIEERTPPTRVLVSCVHSVRDAFLQLHTVLPNLLSKLFLDFLNRTAANAMQALFAQAAASLLSELSQLHGECRALGSSRSSGLDDVLQAISRTEHSMIMHGFSALSDSQPLLSLLGSDRSSSGQLVRSLYGQLVSFFLAFVEASYVYIGRDASEARSLDASLSDAAALGVAELSAIGELDWVGLFGLALVRIGRHLEVKAINKIWSVARDIFNTGDLVGGDPLPNYAVIKATRFGAQAVISHYVLVSGQRLAHFFRNSVQNRNWLTVREPKDPRVVVEMVLKEVHAFDAHLAKILGDPRKPRESRDQRRTRSRFKDSMELEVERLWAKKLQVFASIPFNRNGAVVGILRIAFKALFEYIREETFAKFGLQQIQVDCAFLAEVARDFVEAEDASILDSVLDEVVASASQRCDEPVLMDTTVVEVICDEKKRKGLKFES